MAAGLGPALRLVRGRSKEMTPPPASHDVSFAPSGPEVVGEGGSLKDAGAARTVRGRVATPFCQPS